MTFIKLVLKKYIIFKMFNLDLLKCCFFFLFPIGKNDANCLRMRIGAWSKKVKPSGAEQVAMPALRA
jgi:hypothetical protein